MSVSEGKMKQDIKGKLSAGTQRRRQQEEEEEEMSWGGKSEGETGDGAEGPGEGVSGGGWEGVGVVVVVRTLPADYPVHLAQLCRPTHSLQSRTPYMPQA